jgi:hypothetical protein
MMLPINSYIRNPPKNLLPKQVVSFNAIRYSIDILQISYERLIDNLSELSDNGKTDTLDFPRIFLDVWSIINNAQMFGKIIRKEFNVPKNHNKFSEINKAIDFRNSNQHFEERLSQVLSIKDLPIYGFLSWIKKYPKTNEFVFSTIYSGTFTNKKKINMEISNETHIELNEIIQKIEFSNVIREKDDNNNWVFNEHKISISKIMSDLKNLIDNFNLMVNEQVLNTNVLDVHKSDLIIQMKGKIR